MPSKTSSSNVPHAFGGWFNRELFRRNLIRFWPLWTLYAVVWLVALPVIQAAQLFGSAAKHIPPATLAAQAAAGLLNSAATFNVIICVIFGCLFAMALFSYLCFPRSVDTIHSLPLRREGLFLTNYLSGIVVFVFVGVVVALITAAIQGAGGVLVWGNLGKWLLCSLGEMLFFFSLAVFCTMFTGQLLAAPVFYVIFNFLAIGVTVLVQEFASVFLYGYSAGGIPVWVEWLTPSWKLFRDVCVDSAWNDATRYMDQYALTGLSTVGIYVLAGLALAALALLVYRRRKSETAGDTVAVPWAKPLFRYGVGVCCALSLGVWLYILIWDQLRNGVGYSLVVALICMALTGLIGYFAAEMLLQKSFRVFRKSWKGAAALLAVVVIFGVCLSLDVTGVVRRVPALDRIESVEFSIDGQRYCSGVVDDPQVIDAFRDAHQTLIDGRKELLQRREDAAFSDVSPYFTGFFSVSYRLTNGSTLQRYYTFDYLPAELQSPDSAVSKLAALAVNPEVQKSSILQGFQNPQSITGGDMDYRTFVADGTYQDGDYEIRSVSFDAHVAQAVYYALLEDIDAGHFGRNLFSGNAEQETYINTLTLYGMTSSDDGRMHTLSFNFSSNATAIIAVLQKAGVVSQAHPLTTEAEQNAMGGTETPVEAEAVPADEVTVGIIGGADGPTQIYVN